jgi:hypothetical protein
MRVGQAPAPTDGKTTGNSQQIRRLVFGDVGAPPRPGLSPPTKQAQTSAIEMPDRLADSETVDRVSKMSSPVRRNIPHFCNSMISFVGEILAKAIVKLNERCSSTVSSLPYD